MSQRNKYVNSNLNTALSSQKPGSGYSQPYSQPPRYGTGLVSLGGTKKPRLPASSSASKLAVPRPVNLPSLRKENAGNDPNTQIVPSGSGTSWQKVEEAPPAPADPKTALTAGSTWASTQSKESGWQPPAPAISSLPPPRPGSRRLNPHEYPSLSAAASGRQQSLPKQRVPVVPDAQGLANWDEDERRLPSVQSSLLDGPDRAEEVYRPPWDDRIDTTGTRGGHDDGYAGPPVRHAEEDRWGSASSARRQPYFRGSPGPDRFGSQDRFGAEFPPFAEDPTLFPPPPSTRSSQPPPPPPPRTEGLSDSANTAHVDPEREAFLAQLDSLAQDLEKDRLRKLEAKEVPVAADEEPVQQPTPPPEPEKLLQSPSEPLTLAQVAAAHASEANEAPPLPAAAQLNAKLARRQRELEEEEAERKRKDAAAAKLRALDEAIAAREAERRALEELAARAAAEEAAEAEALAAKKAAEEAAAQEAAAEEAAEEAHRLQAEAKASQATEKVAAPAEEDSKDVEDVSAPPQPGPGTKTRPHAPAQPHQRSAGMEPEVEDSLHGSSVDVQVDSSVAQDAFSDEDRSTGTDTKSSEAQSAPAPPNAWKKPPVSEAVAEAWPEQPIALPTAPASKRKADAAAKDPAAKAQQAPQQRKEGQTAEPARKDKQPAQEPKEQAPTGPASVSEEGAQPQLPPPPVAPKTPALSWRKILAGDEPTPAAILEVPESQNHQPAQAAVKADVGRSRGRGRGREGRGRVERENGPGDVPTGGQDGEGRGRGRGRARGERQGRGRGERKAAAVAAASGNAADPTSPVADIAAAEGHAQEQPRRGRRGNEGRARGGRDSQSSRGRGRAGKSVSSRTSPGGAAPIPPTSVAPAEAPSAPGSALASSQEAKTTSADPVVVLKAPPAAPASVLPAESADMPSSKVALDPPAMPPGLGWDAIAPEPPGLGWGRTNVVPPALEGIGAAGTFPPTSKPVASGTVVGPDPPVERPKSAAGVVSRPRSSGENTMSLPGDLLPNGMPALPADLQLDTPLTMPKEAQKMSAPQAAAEGSGFQGGLFTMPSQQSSSMWQQFGQQQQQQQQLAQQRASTGLPQPQRDQSNPNFALASKGAWGAPAVGGMSPTSQTQLNAFSSGPSSLHGGPPGLQFGQVMSGGFGAFVPTGKQPDWSANTGKQPDWSTGGIGSQPDWSTGPLNSSKGPPPFPAPMALNVAVQPSFSAPQGPGNHARPVGQMQPNGDVGSNGMPHPSAMHSGAAARSADPTANLPDDVFGPDDLQPVEQKFPHMRAAGPPSANHIARGEPDAGGRRGGRAAAAGRVGPSGGRGYSRGRGREAVGDMASSSPDGVVRRGREGPHGPARGHAGQHNRPANGPPQQEGPAGFEGQPGVSRGGYKGMGRERGRAGRAGGRDRMAQWVPLPNSQAQPS